MMKKIFNQLLYPNILIIILFTIISSNGLIYVFLQSKEESILAYVIYTFSMYTLTVCVLYIIKFIKLDKFKDIKNTLYKNKFFKQYCTEFLYRNKVNTFSSFIFNLLYFFFRLIVGLYYDSIWFVSISIYYLIIALLKLMISICHIKNYFNNKIYLFTSLILLLLNIPLLRIIILVIVENNSNVYEGFVIYAIAFYTFYALTLSIVNMIKYKHSDNNIFKLSKTISFITALVSIFMLEASMLQTFPSNLEFSAIMNATTGGVVWIIIVIYCIALFIKFKKNKSNVIN